MKDRVSDCGELKGNGAKRDKKAGEDNLTMVAQNRST
jgi:hypothetical protein